MQNWGKTRKELLLIEAIKTKLCPVYALRLSAKLRKVLLHVHWFCSFQLRTTMLRNTVLCRNSVQPDKGLRTQKSGPDECSASPWQPPQWLW